jgi:hypothetical protein
MQVFQTAGAPPSKRQQHLGDERLHPEKQRRARKQGEREDRRQHRRAHRRSVYSI